MNRINLRPALASMENDKDILYAVVAAFIEEVPSLMGQLDDALATNDKATAERVSHTIKGNFRILQLQNQQGVWATIEQLAHDEQLAQITSVLPEAKVVTDDVLGQLKSILDSREL